MMLTAMQAVIEVDKRVRFKRFGSLQLRRLNTGQSCRFLWRFLWR
jgi:hypothetical protein